MAQALSGQASKRALCQTDCPRKEVGAAHGAGTSVTSLINLLAVDCSTPALQDVYGGQGAIGEGNPPSFFDPRSPHVAKYESSSLTAESRHQVPILLEKAERMLGGSPLEAVECHLLPSESARATSLPTRPSTLWINPSSPSLLQIRSKIGSLTVDLIKNY